MKTVMKNEFYFILNEQIKFCQKKKEKEIKN